MRKIVAADIGGTHARFALARIADGTIVALDEAVTLKTGDFASFRTAYEEFARRSGGELPRELAIAFAGPVGGAALKLTNNPWVIHPALLGSELGASATSSSTISAPSPTPWRAWEPTPSPISADPTRRSHALA